MDEPQKQGRPWPEGKEARQRCRAAMVSASAPNGLRLTKEQWGEMFGISPRTAYWIAYEADLNEVVIVRSCSSPKYFEETIQPSEDGSHRLGKRVLSRLGKPPYRLKVQNGEIIITRKDLAGKTANSE